MGSVHVGEVEDAGDGGEAVDEGWEGAADVGDDEGYVWAAGDGAAEEEVDYGAGGVEEEFEHGPGVLWEGDGFDVSRGEAGGGGVDEDDGFTAVELGEDWVEGFVAQVGAVVVCFHGEAVGVQRVEGVSDFF